MNFIFLAILLAIQCTPQEMLSAGREVMTAGATSAVSSGDTAHFLSAEDATMRWFLLPSDGKATKPAVAPPFQPRVFPRPQGTANEATSSGSGDRAYISSECGAGEKASAESDKVSFHSPPKSLFKPAVEVNEAMKWTSHCIANCLVLCMKTCPLSDFPLFKGLAYLFQAMEEYRMIEDGDKVLVCVSGGKDSLSLLHTLHQYQFMAKSKVSSLHLGV